MLCVGLCCWLVVLLCGCVNRCCVFLVCCLPFVVVFVCCLPFVAVAMFVCYVCLVLVVCSVCLVCVWGPVAVSFEFCLSLMFCCVCSLGVGRCGVLLFLSVVVVCLCL